MKFLIFKNKFAKLPVILAVALILFCGTLSFGPEQAYAAGGTVYTCTINRCYRHPVNGKIEDAGGESSYATGQGMVEGCVYGTGILEVTDSGKYYLTIRMSLFDYTSKHSFKVQKWGASKYSNPAVGITGSGKDSNGTTKDICIQIPSEKSVVRFTMYVEPMGRSVVAYFYPSNFKKGNSTNMKATIVTSAAGSGNSSGKSTSNSAGSSSAGSSGTSGSSSSGKTASGNSSSGSSSGSSKSSSKTSGSSSGGSSSLNSSDSSSSGDGDSSVSMEEPTASDLQSGAAASAGESSGTDSSSGSGSSGSGTSSKAQGLSLSTEEDDGSDDETGASSGGYSVGKRILVNVVSGVIISAATIAMAAGVFYLFRKNYSRWFKTAKDDPYWYDEDGGKEESREQDGEK